MERNAMLKKLSEINVLVAEIVFTYDMGIQFDVLTSEGVCTDIGNIGNWPCYKMPVTDNLKQLKERIVNGENVRNETILEDEICRELLSYTNMYERGSWLIQGEKLEKCIESLKNAIMGLNTNLDSFYAYANLEEWNNDDIKFFDEYEEMNSHFGYLYGSNNELYEEMDDEELERVYNEAKENGWNGVPYKDFKH